MKEEEFLTYTPKRMHRWVLTCQNSDINIPSYVIKGVNRPNTKHKFLYLKIHDPISPSMTEVVWKWYKKKSAVNAILKLIDDKERAVEVWEFKKLKLVSADFGRLDYERSDPCIIDLKLKYGSVDLKEVYL